MASTGRRNVCICSCRYSRGVLGEGCADDPEDWCIGVGDMADYLVCLLYTSWGLGSHTDDENRPLDAVNAQETYGKYNAYFIGDDTKDIYLTFDETEYYK